MSARQQLAIRRADVQLSKGVLPSGARGLRQRRAGWPRASLHVGQIYFRAINILKACFRALSKLFIVVISDSLPWNLVSVTVAGYFPYASLRNIFGITLTWIFSCRVLIPARACLHPKIQGFENEMDDRKLACVCLDVDYYSSTKKCLERFPE
jgi:hypothetical protein